jgi:hypothetical protein
MKSRAIDESLVSSPRVCHYREWFPTLCEVHRTTFARQAANLWKVKEVYSASVIAVGP